MLKHLVILVMILVAQANAWAITRNKAFTIRNDGLTFENTAHFSAGSGAPSHTGKKGDWYFRTDTVSQYYLNADGSTWTLFTAPSGYLLQDGSLPLTGDWYAEKHINIGNQGFSSAAEHALEIRTEFSGDDFFFNGINNETSLTSGSDSDLVGNYTTVTNSSVSSGYDLTGGYYKAITSGSGKSDRVYGMRILSSLGSTGGGTLSSLQDGMEITATHTGTGDVTAINGLAVAARTSGAGATTPLLTGVSITAAAISSSNATKIVGLKIPAITSASTTNRAIESDGGESYHVGKFMFGANTAPNVNLEVTGDSASFTDAASLARSSIGRFYKNFTASGATRDGSLVVDSTINPSGTMTGQSVNNISSIVSVPSGNAQNVTATLRNNFNYFVHAGTGTLTEIVQSYSSLQNVSTGTVTSSIGDEYAVQNSAGGTMTAVENIRISRPVGRTSGSPNSTWTAITGINIQDQNPTGASNTLTNAPVALKIASQTASGAYAIQSDGGQSYHSGNLRIGSTSAPTSALDVTGVGKISTSLYTPQINDSNAVKLLGFTTTGSAVNNWVMANAASAGTPLLSVEGSATNVSMGFQAKGTGTYNFNATSTTGAILKLFEDTDGGTDAISVLAPPMAGSYTLTLPNNDGLTGQPLIDSDGNGTLSFSGVVRLGQINDSNGNELLAFTTLSSAVNYLRIANSQTGIGPLLAATGDDTNVPMLFQSKGHSSTGNYQFAGNSTFGASIAFGEDTDNGTSNTIIRFPSSISADYTYVWPTGDGSNNHVLTTNGSGTLSWAAPASKRTFTFAGGDPAIGGNVTSQLDTAGAASHGIYVPIAMTCTNITILLDSSRTAGTATGRWLVDGVVQTGSAVISTNTDRAAGTMSVNVAANSVITLESVSASFTPTGADVSVFLVCQEQ